MVYSPNSGFNYAELSSQSHILQYLLRLLYSFLLRDAEGLYVFYKMFFESNIRKGQYVPVAISEGLKSRFCIFSRIYLNETVVIAEYF